MNPLTHQIAAEEDGCAVQHILTEVFRMSRSHISRLKRREGGILLNGAPCYSTARCRAGDTVSALISDPPGTKRLEPMEYPLDIVYEDEWLAVVNKPAGLTVHPERSGMGGSVENALTHHFAEDEFVHTVSRLDRGTSGLMTVAKCGYMHELMTKILHTPDFYKEYAALVCGVIEEDSGFVELPLAHPEGSNYMMRYDPDGRSCLTEYAVIERMKDRTLVRLIPHTGRMHQLRVHMAGIGHPIVGDWLYGCEIPETDHPALHSRRLVFKHPLTGARVELEAPLPDDMLSLMERTI
ncbi:MAG: RluA family pseudouridine synthase [Clostridiales bacterium]|nr:RluA family pseudouridine synthase [Clostridiales bacterium]